LTAKEREQWIHVTENVYFPLLEGTNVYLQQDGFMDKVMMNAADLPDSERPINQHWSWDRILRSVFIKQADVLQGIYLFEDRFSEDEIRENFNFYEPKTVHESSLSPCIHSILAARIGDEERAYALYLRTSRLDLDDYNHEVSEGLHITSMAGTWMSIVEGMAGVRVIDGNLSIRPMIPTKWNAYSFQIFFKEQPVHIHVSEKGLEMTNLGADSLDFSVIDNKYTLAAGEKQVITLH
jgi:maltose phosphorylase